MGSTFLKCNIVFFYKPNPIYLTLHWIPCIVGALFYQAILIFVNNFVLVITRLPRSFIESHALRGYCFTRLPWFSYVTLCWLLIVSDITDELTISIDNNIIYIFTFFLIMSYSCLRNTSNFKVFVLWYKREIPGLSVKLIAVWVFYYREEMAEN